jgi:hypothetical protein
MVCVAAESFWCVTATAMAGFALPIFGLVGLLLLVLTGLKLYPQRPSLLVAACVANFVGCALIKTGVPLNPLGWFLHTHSVDLLMIMFASLAAIAVHREGRRPS